MEDVGKLVLRVGLGGLVLFHGVHKLLTGLDPVKSMLVVHKLPEALAYIVYFGEIVGPVLVILGLFARLGAALIALEVLLLVILSGGALSLAPDGGYGLETEALFVIAALAVMLVGPGRHSFGGGRLG